MMQSLAASFGIYEQNQHNQATKYILLWFQKAYTRLEQSCELTTVCLQKQAQSGSFVHDNFAARLKKYLEYFRTTLLKRTTCPF